MNGLEIKTYIGKTMLLIGKIVTCNSIDKQGKNLDIFDQNSYFVSNFLFSSCILQHINTTRPPTLLRNIL